MEVIFFFFPLSVQTRGRVICSSIATVRSPNTGQQSLLTRLQLQQKCFQSLSPSLLEGQELEFCLRLKKYATQ